MSRTLHYQRPWLYEKQAAALFCPERYAFIEASTKSGKTVGCIVWLFEQAALYGRAGRNYWWVAPTLPVAKISYRRMKRAIPRHLYKPNDSEVFLTLINGATIWFKGADRPDTLYGEDVYAAVLDEGSRCKEDAWIALRSTLTATQGPVRIIGNVKGKKNWFYLMSRKAETGMRRAAYFKLTADDAIDAGIFPSEEVAEAREQMPDAAWRELYYAEATDDGSNPFGLEAIGACVQPLSTFPAEAFGWDFARAQDWTVGIGLDWRYHTVKWDRWQGLPWGETYKRVHDVTGPVVAWGDSTGVGDAVVEDVQRLGVRLNAYQFTVPSKQQLMERLATAIQQHEVGFPDGPIRLELESFEFQYTRTGARYSAPEGFHDDCVMALALAVYGRDQLGWIADPTPKQPQPQGVHPGLEVRYKRQLQAMGLLLGGEKPPRSRYKPKEWKRL